MPRYRIILALSVVSLCLSAQDIDEAIKLFNAFQFKHAHEIFKRVVHDKDNPRIAEVYYYLGRLSVNPDTALYYYRVVVRDHPQSRYADVSYLEISKIHIARENYQGAISTLTELLHNYPDTNVKDEVLFWQGVSYIASGQKARGESVLEELRRSFPGSVWSERVATITTPDTQAAEYYTVQVGSYRIADNARRHAEDIRSRGFESTIVETSVKGTTYYRVWVGHFSTREEARAFSAKLDSLGMKGNVVKGY